MRENCLRGKVAIVTGASRGCGRGIALQLADAGCKLYITARLPEKSLSYEFPFLPTLQSTAQECRDRGADCQEFYVDHSNMEEVRDFFELVEQDAEGQLDILVNNAFSAVKNCGNQQQQRFFEVDPQIWDEINNVGLRNQYYCSVYGTRLMIKNGKGLIINISSLGGLLYLFNVPYGAGKMAIDRMSADMGHELRDTNITVISMWPGAVRTELIIQALSSQSGNWGKAANEMFMNGESIEYAGMGVVSLASDSEVHNKTGTIQITTDLSIAYGFTDVNGRIPVNIRSLKGLLNLSGYEKVSSWVPNWLRVPGWLITLSQNKI